MRILTADDVRRAVTMAEAIDVVAEGLSQLARGAAEVPLRVPVPIERHEATTFAMPALLTETDSLAVKVVSVHPRNAARGKAVVNAVVLVVAAETGEPLAVVEGAYLTALRTGAASGVATRLLARPDSRVVAVIGAGAQARTQLEAVRAVLPVEEVRVYARSPDGAAAFAAEVGGAAVASPAAAVRGADVVITATTSSEPVFDGGDLAPGTHVNAVGAFTPAMRELDDAAVRGARLVVDSRAGCLAEAGDILIPMRTGVLAEDAVHAELGELVAGLRPGRASREERTVYKSVGNAAQDAVVASFAVARATELGLGTEVPL
jgi:ornithine cyclodeaminase/alanine dehydrogenase-like protein (mu-crystallin family)